MCNNTNQSDNNTTNNPTNHTIPSPTSPNPRQHHQQQRLKHLSTYTNANTNKNDNNDNNNDNNSNTMQPKQTHFTKQQQQRHNIFEKREIGGKQACRYRPNTLGYIVSRVLDFDTQPLAMGPPYRWKSFDKPMPKKKRRPSRNSGLSSVLPGTGRRAYRCAFEPPPASTKRPSPCRLRAFVSGCVRG